MLVKYGAVGQEVTEICELLKDQGCYSQPISSPTKFDAHVHAAVVYFQQTHIGPTAEPLEVDGTVGDDTWWALNNPSGANQRNAIIPTVPNGIVDERLKVLNIAIGEHQKNVHEIPDGSNRGPEVDKYFPPWITNKFTGLDTHGPSWCCFFAHWVFHTALGYYPCISLMGGCQSFKERAVVGRIYKTAEDPGFNTYIQPGAFFIMLFHALPGSIVHGHTGYILRVSADLKTVNTIEGNCGNRVKCGQRSVSTLTGIINPYKGPVPSFEYGLITNKSVEGDTTE